MADFALWATACETSLWPIGTVMAAYCGNLDDAVEAAIDGDPIAVAVRVLMANSTEWTGTASDLLGALADAAGDRVAKSRTWPHGPRGVSGRLRRAATFLRKIGIEFSFRKEGRARTRIIQITMIPPSAAPGNTVAQPSVPSAPSASTPKSSSADDLAFQPLRTVADDADGRTDDSGRGEPGTVRANPLNTDEVVAADGAGAKTRPQSAPPENGSLGWRARV